MNVLRLSLLLTGLIFSFSTHAQLKLTLWHSFAGSLAQTLERFTDHFNQTQSEYKIELVYKGNYVESLTSFAAAYQGGHPPDMVQVFEVGRDTMLAAKKAFIPADQFLGKTALTNILPSVKQYYSHGQQLMAYPMNVSVPVMYYNKTAVRHILGHDPFPRTWEGVGHLLKKLKKAGYHCGYTTAFPAWLHFESFASLHGLTLMADSASYQVYLRQAPIIRHLQRLQNWQQHKLFSYGGRDSDATHLFTSGFCVLFSQSSGAYQSLKQMASFPIGIAPLPMDEKSSERRYVNAFGGAAIWILRTKDAEKLAGIKAWLNYLADVDTQRRWYRQTGYLPMVSSTALQKNSTLLKIAEQDLVLAKPTLPVSRGPQNQIRTILDQTLETLFSQPVTVQSALALAEKQANYRLLRFQKNYLTTAISRPH